ncbi:MAG: thioredoxin domain-containing protein [Candidatus Omnitrophota bacterium]
MKIRKIRLTILVVITLVLSVQAARFILVQATGRLFVKTVHNRSRGNAGAPVHIIEYTDFECPACAAGSLVLDEYFVKYPKKIFHEYRYFPLMVIHPHALRAAVYGECAARQNKFWVYHDLLSQRRLQWAKSADVEHEFRNLAQEAGIDLLKLGTCVEDKQIEAFILKQKEDGESLGVKATPTFFLNKRMLVGARAIREGLEKYFGEKAHENQ